MDKWKNQLTSRKVDSESVSLLPHQLTCSSLAIAGLLTWDFRALSSQMFHQRLDPCKGFSYCLLRSHHTGDFIPAYKSSHAAKRLNCQSKTPSIHRWKKEKRKNLFGFWMVVFHPLDVLCTPQALLCISWAQLSIKENLDSVTYKNFPIPLTLLTWPAQWSSHHILGCPITTNVSGGQPYAA